MRTNFLMALTACVLTGGVLIAGCGENKTQGKLPADPSQGRPDVESIVKTAQTTKPASGKPTTSQTDTMPTEKELGITMYPHAKPFKDSTGVVTAMSSEGMKIALLETPDSVEKVTAFYKQEMPHASVTKETPEGKPTVRLSEPMGRNGVRAVEIADKEGKTQITLTAVSEIPGLSSAPAVDTPTPPAPATGGQASGVGH